MFSTPASKTCLICYSGTFSDALASFCQNCTSGRYLSDEGTDKLEHDTVDDCLTCSAGTYSGPGAKSCQICASGLYSNSPSSTCKQCGSGRYLSDNGQDREEHDDSSDCEVCAAGRYSAVAAAFCKSCEKGKYIDDNGKLSRYFSFSFFANNKLIFLI